MKNLLSNNKIKVGFVVVIALVLIFVLTQIYAADVITAVATTSVTKVKPGETFTLTCSLTDFKTDAPELAQGISTANVILEYDKNVFEEITSESIKGEDEWNASYESTTGRILLEVPLASGKEKTSACKLFTATFKVKETASKGSTSIALKEIGAAGGPADIAITDVVKQISIEEQDTTVAVTGVSLDKDKMTVEEGANSNLVATVLPENATNKNITWNSSDTTIATVDENGKVTGVKAGTATITATTQDGNHQATCEVTVSEKEQGTTDENNTTGENTVDENTTGGNKNNTSGSTTTNKSNTSGTINANTSNKKIPYAGVTSYIIPIIALLGITARVLYIKYKNIDK